MFKIVGVYEGNREVIDEFDTREEAERMLVEYRMAFGKDWLLSIKEVR